MRNSKYLIGVLVGVIGALAFSSVASAAPLSQTLQTTLAPAKQDKKIFGGVSLHNIIGTTIDNPAATQSPRQTVFTIDPNVKFVNGNIPPCQLSQIQGKFDAQARAACPQSITGQGTVEVNNGAIRGIVTFFSGGPSTIYVQTDIGPGATSLTIIGQIQGKTLTFSNIPNTPGLVLTKFDTTFNKRKTGKMKVKVKGKTKKVPTYYVMARCKAKNRTWSTTETTTFYSGEVLSASSSGKCKVKGSKKK
ncbi:MAG TPA: hypothetical protein VKA41_03115 [Solirubrobacterales bacterium]|nr:hypothetical protein [Solirubrobacterales bacterium]